MRHHHHHHEIVDPTVRFGQYAALRLLKPRADASTLNGRTSRAVAFVPADGAYVTPGQAAHLLGVSPKTVTRWAQEGRLPCVSTLGGHRRFRADVIRSVATSMGVDAPEVGDQPTEP